MAKVQFLLYTTTITLNVSKYGIRMWERYVFWSEILCVCTIVTAADEWVELHLSGPTINILISGSFNGAGFPLSCLPSTITHIMYLKCLLHNLCSINFCFKGCDTTSAHYFPRLCSFSNVYFQLLCDLWIRTRLCLCVWVWERVSNESDTVQLYHQWWQTPVCGFLTRIIKKEEL